MLNELNELTRKEQRAFLAWFSGGMSNVIQSNSNKDDVCMGKYECEQVSFQEFWLEKLPNLGWFEVKLIKRNSNYTEFLISPTEKGSLIRKAYWEFLDNGK